MNKLPILTFLVLLAVCSSYALLGSASPSIQQTTPPCPTYQVNLVVDIVDSNPINAAVGDIVVTRVHVVYVDGTPVSLSPVTISFQWNGTSGHKEFDNVPVVYTGTPGFYNYTQPITSDLIQATGQGTVTISVVACSCSDGGGNRGPVRLTDSDVTLVPSDNSNLNIGIPQPPSPLGQAATYFVPLAIIILLIIALLLFLRRRRAKQQK